MGIDLVSAYRTMYLIRSVENTILEGIKTGIFPGTTHACIGQEAVSVGVLGARSKDDVVFSNHRGHGHMLSSGLDLRSFFSELAGMEGGVCGGIGGSQHISDPSIGFMGSNGITGGQVPVAVGHALANKLKGNTGRVIVFFGDGAINQGAVFEAINMAAIWEVPILFVCENNKYAMSTPTERGIAGSITERVSSLGILTFVVDGMDVEHVFNTSSAMLRRNTVGFMVCDTYRYCGHSKSDMCLYRTKEELNYWKSRDPIVSCGEKLESLGVDTSSIRAGVDKEISEVLISTGLSNG